MPPQPVAVWLLLGRELMATKTFFPCVYCKHLAPIMNQASQCFNPINANQNCQNLFFFFFSPLSLCSWVNFCHVDILYDLGFDFVADLTRI